VSDSPPPEVDLDAIERDLDEVERTLDRLARGERGADDGAGHSAAPDRPADVSTRDHA
jgi:hypothetical protein